MFFSLGAVLVVTVEYFQLAFFWFFVGWQMDFFPGWQCRSVFTEFFLLFRQSKSKCCWCRKIFSRESPTDESCPAKVAIRDWGAMLDGSGLGCPHSGF